MVRCSDTKQVQWQGKNRTDNLLQRFQIRYTRNFLQENIGPCIRKLYVLLLLACGMPMVDCEVVILIAYKEAFLRLDDFLRTIGHN